MNATVKATLSQVMAEFGRKGGKRGSHADKVAAGRLGGLARAKALKDAEAKGKARK